MIVNEMAIVVSKSCRVKRWHNFFAVVHHMMSCFFYFRIVGGLAWGSGKSRSGGREERMLLDSFTTALWNYTSKLEPSNPHTAPEEKQDIIEAFCVLSSW